MKPCINCGKQLPDGAHFCPYCTAVQNKKQQAAEPKPRRMKRRTGLFLIIVVIIAAVCVSGVVLKQKNQNRNSGLDVQETELEFAGHRYQLIAEGMDWQEAVEWCEAAGGQLACITSQEEADAVNTILRPELTEGDDGLGGFWIGAYKEVTAAAEWEWVNGSPVTFTNWAGGNPDHSGTVVKAVSDEGHPWDDTPFEEHCPIYEIEAADDLQNESHAEAPDAGEIVQLFESVRGAACKSVTYGSHTYVLIEEQMDWETALRLPDETGLDGYLACFETKEEYQAVSAIMESDLEKDRDDCWGGYWIGLRLKTPETYEWKWTSGEAFTYNNWADGQPDQSGYAVKIVPDWNNQWDDISGEKHCFICEWK